MLKLCVLVSGGGTNLQAIIDAIESGMIQNAEIAMVISNNRNAYALKRAAEYKLPYCCISPKDYEGREQFNAAFMDKIIDVNPGLIVLAGFLVVLPELLIQKFRHKIINIHPSLLPAFGGKGYYGLKVHEGAIQRGVKITGATVHFVDEGTDTGPIILQHAVNVEPADTPEILQKRVMEQAEWLILPWAINLIAAGRVRLEHNKVYISED